MIVSKDFFFCAGLFPPISCLGGYKLAANVMGVKWGKGVLGLPFICGLLVTFFVLIMAPLSLEYLMTLRFNFPRH